MESEFMGQESIIALLKSQGLDPIAKQDGSQLIISKNVIRCEDGDTLIVGMGSDMGKDDQIHLVVDAVHLCLQSKKRNLRLILGKRTDEAEWAEVKNAVAIMIGSIDISLKIEIEVDSEKKVDFQSESFDEDPEGKIESWMQYLSRETEIPEFAKVLERAIHDPLFKWYRSVTGRYCSGRVGGLEVCRVYLADQHAELKVGKQGRSGNGPAREVFLKILEKEDIEEGSFTLSQLTKVASVIRVIAVSRRNGALKELQKEHLLESYILSGERIIESKAGVLGPVLGNHPFQFPTLWSPKGAPRFVDALMRRGDVPYVVELKEPSGFSRGQGYRHAITQAVLYREYVRRTEKVHHWFRQKGLAPDKCRAVVAFPEMTKGDKKINQMLLDQLTLVGNAFGVEIVEIKGFE
jgi:hypothetical protein